MSTLLVLGATGTVGRAVVAAALQAGHRVIAIARHRGRLEALAATHPGAALTVMRAALSGERSGAALAARLERQGIAPDALIVALRAGAARGRLLDSQTGALRLDRDLAPHLVAARHLLPRLATSSLARAVVVGGPGSDTPWAGYGERAVTAAALRMLVRVLHEEARSIGVRVQLLDVTAPSCSDAEAAQCPQRPRLRAVAERALTLATARRGRIEPAVVPFDLASPPQRSDLADARALLRSISPLQDRLP